MKICLRRGLPPLGLTPAPNPLNSNQTQNNKISQTDLTSSFLEVTFIHWIDKAKIVTKHVTNSRAVAHKNWMVK